MRSVCRDLQRVKGHLFIVRYSRYSEGDVFAVPLENNRFVLGVVGRKPRQNRHLILGFFFRGVFTELPSPTQLPVLRATDASLVAKCDDLGLTTGRWPLVARMEQWAKESWPMPKFRFKGSLLCYSDDDLYDVIAKEQSEANLDDYPEEGVMGARYVEESLLMLVDPGFAPITVSEDVADRLVGMYDDDDFQDFLGLFEELPSRKLLFEALTRVADAPFNEYIDLQPCGFAIAASVIIAATASEYRKPIFDQPMSITFASQLNKNDLRHFASLALRAIDRILSKSELKELWEEAEPSERDLRFKQLKELHERVFALPRLG